MMQARGMLNRTRVNWLVIPALMIAIFGSLTMNIASAQESTPASETEIGVLDTAAVYIACDENVTAEEAGADATQIPATSPSTVYAVDSAQSSVGYVAQEELSSIGATTAEGITNQIVGNIYFDADGNPLVCSRFDADLRTLTSDKSQRDNYLRGNTLETDTYPIATFVVTAIEGLDAGLVDGEETEVVLIGNLSIHGLTRQVAWDGTVVLSGDTITASASTTFYLEDFELEKPIVGPVLSIDDTIELKISLVAVKAT